jgi:glyceraldehyde 3-phosphate dehydrogenase
MVNVAINGLGRMGKLVLRAFVDDGLDANIVLLNDTAGTPESHAHLLEFDSVHGRWNAAFEHDGESVTVNGRKMVLSTGKRIEDLYDPAEHHLVTAASCTTNCLAPVVKVLHEEIGISHGSITTVHDVTNTQTIVDRPAKDLRRARSALTSLIPTTTGSATAITLIYPELKGRLNGHAVRVPLLNASLTDCVFEMQRATSVEEVNGLFENWADGKLKGILGYETRPLVSADYLNDPRSAIVDALSTMVVNGTQVKVYAWYDNEWGYACRLADVTRLVVAGMS